MAETKTRPASAAYPRRVSLYETDEGYGLLSELARRRGVSISDLLRMLVREEARREGVEAEGTR